MHDRNKTDETITQNDEFKTPAETENDEEREEFACTHQSLKDATKPCPMVFKRAADLRRHIRVHTNEKPFECDTCGKCFVQRHALTVHERVHTGEKPFACDWTDCDKRFHDSSSLVRHRRTHTCERLYSCKICLENAPPEALKKPIIQDGKKRTFALGQFTRKVTLKRHLLRFHRIMLDDDDNYVECTPEQVDELEAKYGISGKKPPRPRPSKRSRSQSVEPTSDLEDRVKKTSRGKKVKQVKATNDTIDEASVDTPETTVDTPVDTMVPYIPVDYQKFDSLVQAAAIDSQVGNTIDSQRSDLYHLEFDKHLESELLGGYFTVTDPEDVHVNQGGGKVMSPYLMEMLEQSKKDAIDSDLWDYRDYDSDSYSSLPGTPCSEAESIAAGPSVDVKSQTELITQLRALLNSLEGGQIDKAQALLSSPGLSHATPFLTSDSRFVSPKRVQTPLLPSPHRARAPPLSNGNTLPSTPLKNPWNGPLSGKHEMEEFTTLHQDSDDESGYDTESTQAVDDFLDSVHV